MRKDWPDWTGWQIIDGYIKRIGRDLQQGEVVKDPHILAALSSFYRPNFWQPIQGDAIKTQLIAEFLFDWYVNAGSNAVRSLQFILGAKIDGQLGP